MDGYGGMLIDCSLWQLQSYNQVWIAYSGGLDSTVLLHLLYQQPALAGRLRAVHVHHGISAFADEWAAHCQKVCDTWDIPLLIHRVLLEGRSNLEALARNARYQVFASLVQPNDVLLLAHHADDQAETILLQLMRGTGIAGLAGMQRQRHFEDGMLQRPLLDYSRDELHLYAQQHHLSWIEDDSNQNQFFSRNYLRHEIIPRLKSRWPQVTRQLANTANHCQVAQKNLLDLASQDVSPLQQTTLKLSSLSELSFERLQNVLRMWLKNNRIMSPSTAQLMQLQVAVIGARSDARAEIRWGKTLIRRYHNQLYILRLPLPSLPENTDWSTFSADLYWPASQLRLRAKRALSYGLWVCSPQSLEVRFRQGGESIRYQGQHKSLKKLLQSWGIPPWERNFIPLIYMEGQLVAVGDAIIHDDYRRHVDEVADVYTFSYRLSPVA